MKEPPWLQIARQDLGLKEVPGAENAPAIIRMWALIKAPFNLDSVPWCGGACGAWFTQAGYAPPAACWRAKAWLDWGRPLTEPVLGCVVVFGRDGGGHVALAVGRNERGGLVCLGGNQGDAVSLAAFSFDRVLGYRVPVGDRQYDPLPMLNADFSRSEA